MKTRQTGPIRKTSPSAYTWRYLLALGFLGVFAAARHLILLHKTQEQIRSGLFDVGSIERLGLWFLVTTLIALAAVGIFIFRPMVQRIRQEMDQQERLATIGQVSGSIAHELRNPLAIIDSSAYYLKATLGKADPKPLEHLDRIRVAVSACVDVVQSLLDLTRIKAPSFETLDVIGLLDEAIETGRRGTDMRVDKGYLPDKVPILGDGRQLMMVFANIVKNAADAMGGNGLLRVSTEMPEGKILITFADAGPGIPRENLKRIFEPLFTTKAKGIGFGLSIAKTVVEKHEGRIWVKSKIGEGTTFGVQLPTLQSMEKR